jgi:type II secretory pathway pseudopilin PulG
MRGPALGSRRVRAGGFTIVEVAFAATLLGLLMLAATSIASTSSDALGTSQVSARVETRLQRAMLRVARELTSTGADVLTPDGSGQFGTHDFTFCQAVGSTGDAIDWSAPRRLAWEAEPGEADNGLDDDGDGLVDEGVLVLVRDPGGPAERRTVLCRGVTEWMPGEVPDGDDDNGNGVVDERGFNVQRVGAVLTIRLAVAAADSEGRTAVSTTETAVRLRN